MSNIYLNRLKSLNSNETAINLDNEEINLKELINYAMQNTTYNTFKKYHIKDKAVDLLFKKHIGISKRKLFKMFDEDAYNKFKKVSSKRWTKDTFLKEATPILEYLNMSMLTDYLNTSEKILLRCNICKSEFYVTPHSIFKGNGCKTCHMNAFCKSEEDIRRQYSEQLYKLEGWSWNKDISFANINTFRHSCGYELKYTMYHFLNFHSGFCSQCEGKTMSWGEALIATILSFNNIEYIKEFVFPKSRKRFDFYLPKYNLLIEYDGIQHYKEIDFFKYNLKKIKVNDNYKNQLAKKHNKKLIRISYKNESLKDILQILSNQLKLKLQYPKEEMIASTIKNNPLKYKKIVEYYKNHSEKKTCEKFNISAYKLYKYFKIFNKGLNKTQYLESKYSKTEKINIVANYYLNHSFKDTADKFHMSWSTINEYFKQKYKMSKTEYLQKNNL